MLSEVEFKRACYLLLSLDLSSAAYTTQANDFNSKSLAEELSFQEVVRVSDGNDVSRDACRYVSCLSLNDRQAVSDPLPCFSFILAARCSSLDCRQDSCQGRLHVQEDAAAVETFGDRLLSVWIGRHRG